MRNRIFGAVGVLWGGSILFRWYTSSLPPAANSAYAAGERFAVLFGLAMLVVGLYYLFKKSM
jgi:hypothetical protein